MKRKIVWTNLVLWDSDGNHPNEETEMRKLTEYRRMGCITDYWLTDPRNDDDAWKRGPEPSAIDWTGFVETEEI